MPLPLFALKRHLVAIASHFDHSLVLTYALPAEVLAPLVPPGLEVDRYGDWGFIAVALVDVHGLRPRGLPAGLGASFFLSGYRIFVRHHNNDGRLLRGLYILSSDTDSRLLQVGANAMAHYRYRRSEVHTEVDDQRFRIQIATPGAVADLDVVADLTSIPATLPLGSPFEGTNDSRRFAGPLPWTFDYEPETHSIIKVRGRRDQWHPAPVSVDVKTCTFFDQPTFAGCTPVLANAFYVSDLPYSWDRGIRASLPA